MCLVIASLRRSAYIWQCKNIFIAIHADKRYFSHTPYHRMKPLLVRPLPAALPTNTPLPQLRAVRISLRVQILAFALFIVVFAVIIAVFAFIQRAVLTASVQAGELQAELLKAHDSKSKFAFRRSKVDADEVERHVAKAFLLLEHFDRDEDAQHLFSKTKHYRAVFQDLTAKVQERGINENSGAEGTFRTAIHNAQNIAAKFNQKSLEIVLLQARRREKDFFMRGDEAYIGEVRQLIRNAYTVNASSSLALEERTQIAYHLATYIEAFDKAATLVRSIKALDEQLNSDMERIEPLIGNIVAVRQERSAVVENVVLAVVFFCLLSSIILAFWIAYRIAAPILSLERAAQKVASGNHDITVSVRSRDEVGNLAQAFNVMVANVRERTSELERTNAEVRKANALINHQKDLLEEQTIATQRANLELSSANIKLKRVNSDLERANQEKNEFLGIAAHDLKNPLMGMRGLISLLELAADELSKADIQETAQILQRSVERMVTIVNNLLDINAIETGNMHLNIRPFNLTDIAADTLKDYILRAEEKSITLHFMTDSEAATALGDSIATRQILDNLVSNAVKYSPSGRRIWVRVAEEQGFIRIAVQDEGPGLSEDDKKKLFGKFVRLSAQPTGNEHSTGLGLSIVKRMVEAMQGRVWCEAELGKGATFFVELPSVRVDTVRELERVV
jgi:signal transduction histidine kinase